MRNKPAPVACAAGAALIAQAGKIKNFCTEYYLHSENFMGTNKRKRSRVDSGNIPGCLLCSGDEIPVTLINISLNGALVKQEQPLPEETPCTLIIRLTEDIVIKADCHIVRTDTANAALTFDEIDADSYPHLHRLVQLHAASPDIIDKELNLPRK